MSQEEKPGKKKKGEGDGLPRLEYISKGIKQIFQQKKDGSLELLESVRIHGDGPRRFRLRQIPTDLRRCVKRRTLKRLSPKQDAENKPQFYKWFQENVYGQKRDKEKENIISVDSKTAIDLEMQSDVFEEVMD